jgi:ribonucleoside-diphosphate reductase alpha subunit
MTITQILTNAVENTNLNFTPKELMLLKQEIEMRVTETIFTQDLVELCATYINSQSLYNRDYSYLASRILMQHIHNTLPLNFKTCIEKQYNELVMGEKSPRISDEFMAFVNSCPDELQSIINIEQDYIFDYTQLQSYLKSSLRRFSTKDRELAETPQQMFLRVAIGTSNPHLEIQDRLKEIKEYYQQLSELKISPQSPIIVHAGSKYNQMPSCYLQYCEDSMCGSEEYEKEGVINGILGAVAQMGQQGKSGGATGINISDVRANGSYIRKTGGNSNGIVPFMKIFDSAIAAINQGGRRAGVCTLYIEPWHADIMEFLGAGEHFTTEEKRCKNLFFALYTNDLFFERMVKGGANAKWTLFDPAVVRQYTKTRPNLSGNTSYSLSDVYGEEFKTIYEEMERLSLGKEMLLNDLWSKVCKLIQINGNPYIVHKDSINAKSNQQNQGVIKGSNVCCEVTLVSDRDNTGVCVLSSISLPRFVNVETRDFDFIGLIETARLATRSLNNVLDIQHYPTPQTKNSALNSRAIGIGAQGLADVFAMLKLDFDSEQAKKINKIIYEVIYYACLVESCELAQKYGKYNLYEGSPISKGILQYDMWKNEDGEIGIKDEKTFLGAETWGDLRKAIKLHGVRNSEVTALMPTASSSIRMGNTEMHEPFTRNIFVRRYIGGEALVVNQHLVKHLNELDLWDGKMANLIIENDGSIQNIDIIPAEIKSRYRTAYEINHKDLTKMMADRSPFVSQSSSYNHYVNVEKMGQLEITNRILFAWKKSLKTLSYYFHTGSASKGKQIMGVEDDLNDINKMVNININSDTTTSSSDERFCNINDPDCESCQA